MSKKQGMPGVKASSDLSPAEYLARCEDAARRRGFRVTHFGDVAGCPLVALTRRTPGPRPRIYLSSGIHGDEPAPPLALLSLLEQGEFDDRATWFIAPMLNPLGFLRRTRENAEAIDLNRDYRARQAAEVRAHIRWLELQPPFDLALCLHEDWEATGFYLYELKPDAAESLTGPILVAAARVMPIDPAAMIDGRPVTEPGIIRPDHDVLQRELWAEAIYLRAHHTSFSYTLETPSARPMEQRVAAMAAAVQGGLAAYFASAGAAAAGR